MALVIEDGSIVAGATSFVTRAELIEYAKARGKVIPDEDASDVFLIQAMDYMQTLCYKGDAVTGLPYPRTGVREGDTVPGFELIVPPGIKLAQLQLALDAANGVVLTQSGTAPGVLKRSKVGPIEREFFEPSGGASAEPALAVATAYLAAFMCDEGGFSLRSIRV